MKAAINALLLVMIIGTALDVASSQTASPQQSQLSTGPRTSSWEGLAIVVSKRNPIENVAFWQLRQIFSEEKRWWSSRRRVTLVAMPWGSAERQTMLQVVYRMNDRDLDKYFFWRDYQGDFSTYPTTLATPGEVRKFVSNTPGAIAYLRASDVDNSVKVVRVNGLLPGDDGHPLRLQARLTK